MIESVYGIKKKLNEVIVQFLKSTFEFGAFPSF